MNLPDIRQFDVEYSDVKQDTIHLYEYCFQGTGILQISQWNEYSYQILYNIGQLIDFAIPTRCINILPLEYVDEYMRNKDNILDPYVNLALLLITPSYESQFYNQYYLKTNSLIIARRNIADFDTRKHREEMRRLLPQPYLSILKFLPKQGQLVYKGTPFIPHNVYAKPFVYNVTPIQSVFVDADTLLSRLRNHLSFISDFISTIEYPSGKIYSMVCGGFVLRCARDDLYQDISKSDIDIFVTGDENAKKEHIQKMVEYLENMDYRFSSIGPVITCVSRESDSFQIQIINSKFDNPVSVIDYFDFSHIQMMYDGNRVICTSEWYKYSPVGLTNIKVHRIKQYRISKAIERGFVPCFNEMNSLGYNISGETSTGIYYNNEYTVSLPKNKILTNNPPEITRTFTMAKDVIIESSFLDNDTYNVSTSQKCMHILEAPNNYIGKVYCNGIYYIEYENNNLLKVYIRDIMIPIKIQDVQAGLFNNKTYQFNYARINYKPANFKYVDKLLKNHRYSYMNTFAANILSEYPILNRIVTVYNMKPSLETFQPVENYIRTNLTEIEDRFPNIMDMLINYFRYIYPMGSFNHSIVSDDNFNWYLVNIPLICHKTTRSYYEGKYIRKNKSKEQGIIFMMDDGEKYILSKVMDNNSSFKYSS